MQSDSPDDANSPSKYVLALLEEKKRQSRWFAELAALQFLAALTDHGEEAGVHPAEARPPLPAAVVSLGGGGSGPLK